MTKKENCNPSNLKKDEKEGSEALPYDFFDSNDMKMTSFVKLTDENRKKTKEFNSLIDALSVSKNSAQRNGEW